MIYNEVLTNDLFTEDLTGERNKVQKFLRDNPQTIVDVGGAMGSWVDADEGINVTAYLDCNATQYLSGKTNAFLFDGNISDSEGWEGILREVDSFGKFDFGVCTQTLEDIRNPSLVLQMLPKVAKAGYIDVPSKYHEFRICELPDPVSSWGIDSHILGYSGHRWIMNMVNKTLEMYPKLPFIEHLTALQWLRESPAEKLMLCFWWKDDIPFRIVGDDFLGPNPPSIYKMYIDGLREGL